MRTDPTIKPRFFAIRVDRIEDWPEEERKRLHLKHQWDIYVYDETSQTHCCELTPSYDLRYVDFSFELDDSAPEDEAGVFDEMVYDAIMEANSQTELSMYMHCRSVDSMELGVDRKFVDEPPDTMPPEDWMDDKGYEDIFESVCDHVRGNAIW